VAPFIVLLTRGWRGMIAAIRRLSALGRWSGTAARRAQQGPKQSRARRPVLLHLRKFASTVHNGGPIPLAPGLGRFKFQIVFHFDPLYLAFLLPGLVLSFWASARVKSTFNRYSQVASRRGWTGAAAARELIRQRGADGVRVEETPGFLSDHYDPSARVLRLSPDVYHGRSLAALGVAAHEAGHAIQHAKKYGPLSFRSLVVKPAMIGSNIAPLIATAGFFMQSANLVWLGVITFSAFVLFTLVTLPVEFDASNRAVAALQETGMIEVSEVPGARAVLRAAAMTYVASAVSAILQLLYFVMRANSMNDRD
jgi:Zn-dependent membrane protease YugP